MLCSRERVSQKKMWERLLSRSFLVLILWLENLELSFQTSSAIWWKLVPLRFAAASPPSGEPSVTVLPGTAHRLHTVLPFLGKPWVHRHLYPQPNSHRWFCYPMSLVTKPVEGERPFTHQSRLTILELAWENLA